MDIANLPAEIQNTIFYYYAEHPTSARIKKYWKEYCEWDQKKSEWERRSGYKYEDYCYDFKFQFSIEELNYICEFNN